MKNIIFTAVVLATTALVGCKVDVPQNRPAADISGVAADNIIRNGEVRVYAWNGNEREILLSTKTDNYGYYVDPLQAESQFIKICVVGGEYTEEASSVNIRLENGDRMCAITYWESGQAQETMVTPETNMAAALMEYEVKSGKGNLQNIVSNANSKIGALFGYDILTTKPADMTSDDLAYTGLNDSVRSGLWHAAFSRIALNAAKANGQSTHTNLISSMALHKAIYRDLSADGKLDGWGVAENGKTKVRLGLGSFELNANVYRTELAKELVNFVKSDRNKTAVKTNDVLSYATTFSLTTDSIFSDKDVPVAFDDEAPVVAFDTPEYTYISRIFELGVKVTDFSGVKSVTYSLNDNTPDVFDFTQDKLVINTTEFNDGDLVLALTVTDSLDNTAVIKRTFRVANQQPLVNITSKRLVKERTYTFKATVGEVKAGIASITVDDKNALYADNEISIDLNLKSGKNTLVMVLTDNSGAEHNYSFIVNVDAQSPTLKFSTADWFVRFKSSSKTYENARFTENERRNIYITPKFFSLGAMLPTSENLSVNNWPTLRFVVSDEPIGGNYATAIKDLKISLKVIDADGFVSRERNLTISENDGVVLVPLSEQFLGKDWYKDTGLIEGSSKVIFTLVDEAVNQTNFSWSPHFVVSITSIDMGLYIDKSQLSGNQKLMFNGNDLIDTDLIIDLDGKTETIVSWPQDYYELDTTKLNDGHHYLNIKIRGDNKEIIKTVSYEFSVDNTSPIINVTSPVLTNNANYEAVGEAYDTGSGLDLLTINGRKESFLNNGLFKKNMNLIAGVNIITVEATDIAGNSAEINHSVMFDNYKPLFNPVVSVEGKITGVETQEWKLWDNTMTARYGIADPDNALELKLEFSEIDDRGNLSKPPHPFFLDERNNNLQNVALDDVGGVVNAINSDGSLNTQSFKAFYYLYNKKIPFFSFYASDAYPDTTLSNLDKIKVKYRIEYGAELIKYEELLPTESDHPDKKNYYLLPLTQEFFTHELLDWQPDKDIKVTFELYDEAGNLTTKEYIFNVFNAAAKTAVKPSFDGGLNRTGVGNDNLNLKLAAEAAIGLSKVSLIDTSDSKNNFEWSALKNSPLKVTKKVDIPVKSKSAEGQYSWTLSVTDLAGNTTTQSYQAEIDKTPPLILDANVPSSLYLGGATQLRAKATDKNEVEVTASLNGKPVYIFAGEKTISASDVVEGMNTWSVTAKDIAGNTSTRQFKFNAHVKHEYTRSGRTVKFSRPVEFISGWFTDFPDCIGCSVSSFPSSRIIWKSNTEIEVQVYSPAAWGATFKDDLGLEFSISSR